MGTVVSFGRCCGLAGGEAPVENDAADVYDAWSTPIGGVLRELSTQQHSCEVTPLRRDDAQLLLTHLSHRGLPFFDRNVSQWMRSDILDLMIMPLADKRAFVRRMLAQVANPTCIGGTRAANAWVVCPLDGFTSALCAAYRVRDELLSDSRLVYLRGVFLICLFKANVPAETVAAMPLAAPSVPRLPRR